MEKQIDISLEKCTEIKVEFFPSELGCCSKENLEVGFGLKFRKESDNTLAINIFVEMLCNDKRVLFHESEYWLNIPQLDNAVLIDGENVEDKVGVLPTLLGICFSTARGMITVRTSGTILDDFPLPIINPTEVLDSMKRG